MLARNAATINNPGQCQTVGWNRQTPAQFSAACRQYSSETDDYEVSSKSGTIGAIAPHGFEAVWRRIKCFICADLVEAKAGPRAPFDDP
jgi:hypothetical protein